MGYNFENMFNFAASEIMKDMSKEEKKSLKEALDKEAKEDRPIDKLADEKDSGVVTLPPCDYRGKYYFKTYAVHISEEDFAELPQRVGNLMVERRLDIVDLKYSTSVVNDKPVYSLFIVFAPRD